MTRDAFIVGIAGVSGIGKSTLARELRHALDSPVFPYCLDDYTRTKVVSSRNEDWNNPRAFNWQGLKDDLKRAKAELRRTDVVPRRIDTQKTQVYTRNNAVMEPMAGTPLPNPVYIIVEGFLLYLDKDLADLCDMHLWLEAESP